MAQKRVKNALQLREGVRGLHSLSSMPWRKGVEPAAYRETLLVKPEKLATGWSRDATVRGLRSLGVPCSSGAATELHRAPAFSTHPNSRSVHTPAAAALAERSIAFCVRPTLEASHMAAISASIRSVMALAAPAPTMA